MIPWQKKILLYERDEISSASIGDSRAKTQRAQRRGSGNQVGRVLGMRVTTAGRYRPPRLFQRRRRGTVIAVESPAVQKVRRTGTNQIEGFRLLSASHVLSLKKIVAAGEMLRYNGLSRNRPDRIDLLRNLVLAKSAYLFSNKRDLCILR
jgi:hypothetical protein